MADESFADACGTNVAQQRTMIRAISRYLAELRRVEYASSPSTWPTLA
jgi:hypothetical protein